MGDKRRIEGQRNRYKTALEEIAFAKEQQPVRKKTGVSGEPRFLHAWPSRYVALVALGEINPDPPVT